jgi:hypothetical protein
VIEEHRKPLEGPSTHVEGRASVDETQSKERQKPAPRLARLCDLTGAVE